jgi:hypothetical protein
LINPIPCSCIPLANLQTAKRQEDSSIYVSPREFWTSTRSIPQTPSPRTPSAISTSPSNVSNLELTDPDPSDPSSTSLHPYPEFRTAHNLPDIISDPATHLPIPRFTTSEQLLPATMTHQTMPFVSNLAKMPRRSSKHAPPLFKGEFWRVTRFVELYCQLLEYHQIITEQDKCKGILEYCSQTVEDFITSCPNFINSNWEGLKGDILKYYDAERMETRIQLGDFVVFLQKSVKKSITSLSQWKKYNRKYLSYAGFLMRNNQLSETEYEGYFWYGIPEDLRSILEVRLQAQNPTFDNLIEPWPITEVQRIAEAYLKCNKFSDKLFHLPALGMGRCYDDDDDDEKRSMKIQMKTQIQKKSIVARRRSHLERSRRHPLPLTSCPLFIL